MKVLELKTLRGPNYWSAHRHHLIVAKLDIGKFESLPTNKIPDFGARLLGLIPTLHEHSCSEGHEGGFMERIQEGTWIAHVIEHIALELQCLAGMDVRYGRTRSTDKKGVYNVALAYEVAEAGRYALEAAIQIAQNLTNNEAHDIQKDIKQLRYLKAHYGLGVTTAAIINEARRRNIPYKRLNNASLFMLGYGCNQKRIEASMTCATSGISIDTASDKQETKRILYHAYMPVPEGEVVTTLEELHAAVKQLGFPLVLKPIDANQGKGITTNIQSEEQLELAFKAAQNYSDRVIVERFIEGNDYRMLVINHKVVATAHRLPALVTGNGRSTIKELVDEVNKDPRRGEGHEKTLTMITINEASEKLLSEKGLSVDSVPKEGEVVFLKTTANLSTGGTSTDVTDSVHPHNIFLAERISRIIDLDICGIDIIAKDIKQPLDPSNGAVLEVNACPGLRMHISPSKGLPRNVAEPIVSMLFPEGSSARIPIVAVTGSNGKTTTTRLVAHIAKTAGYKVGCTTTDGIYIDGHAVFYGDCTGSASAESVLSDSLVDFAALECARGGILRSGLGFDECDVSIITNITEDHLGLEGINSIREMAKVKSVIAFATKQDGYTILNAEDDQSYYTIDYVDCNVALFALDPENERIKEHCVKYRGLAAVIDDGYVTIYKGRWKTRICKVADVPLTVKGEVGFQVKNVLAAVLAAHVRNIKPDIIKKALLSFVPSPELTPGRMNSFKFRDIEVIVDYAHNPAAFIELKRFLDQKSNYKVGIITGVGDRREEDIRQLGAIAADIFDEIIIRHDDDLRGNTQERISDLLIEGIREKNRSIPLQIISQEKEAISYAISAARPGAVIYSFTEHVQDILNYVAKLREDELHKTPAIVTIQ